MLIIWHVLARSKLGSNVWLTCYLAVSLVELQSAFLTGGELDLGAGFYLIIVHIHFS
jgi:hypothetical protein